MITVSQLITAAEEIAVEEPRYQLGHDGSDGYCDCIGLIIGAIRRAGGQWRGMHGSNYAARAEVRKIQPIVASSVLKRGEAVFKAYEPGVGGYNLPERYSPGGNSYTGDLHDYYHVGIVESVYPLRIRHMTSPRAKMDTSLGKWSYHGELIKVDYDTDGGKDEKMSKVIISGGNADAPIHLRKAASTASPIVAEIPQGSTAELIENGGSWNQIKWNGRTGYVMAKFVTPAGDGSCEDTTGDTVTVSRKDLEKIYDTLGDWLGLRG